MTGEDVSGVRRSAVACKWTSALLRRNVVVGGKSLWVAGKLKAWLTILIAVDLRRLPKVVIHLGRTVLAWRYQALYHVIDGEPLDPSAEIANRHIDGRSVACFDVDGRLGLRLH